MLLPASFRRLVLLAACVCCSPSQAAGTLLLIDVPPAASTWALGVGAHGWPASPGASTRQRELWPAFDYAAPNGFFASTDDSIGWNLAPLLMDEPQVKTWQWGARLWPQRERAGTRVLGEAFANVQLLPVLLLQSGASFDAHGGAQLELGATSGIPIGAELIGISLAASYANAAQLRDGYGATTGTSGWQDWSLAISAEHRFSAQWSVSGQWLGARLLGPAARAPLTQSRFQPSFSLSLWRHF